MPLSILVVDDEENFRSNIMDYLSGKGHQMTGVGTLADARAEVAENEHDLVLLDVTLPDGYGPSLLYETASIPQGPLVILMTAYGDIDMAVDAMKNGAQDFLTKPVEFAQVEKSIHRVEQIIAMRRELSHLRRSQNPRQDFVVGQNKEYRAMLKVAERAAHASVSVLITGLSGTGKEVLANYIYESGPRKGKPMIAINCAAIQPTMLESELFGYEGHAFTGASEKKKYGLFEVADGGILFLDEISSMPLELQAKLLRVLEERAFRRVGGTQLIRIDVQIIAASNRDLPTLIEEQKFREDLYYRLKVVDLHLPSLAERRPDIPEFVGFFVRYFNAKMGMNVVEVTPLALEALTGYSWPGNIRELSNAIERAMLFCDGEKIDLSDLPDLTEKGAKPAPAVGM